MVSERLGHYRIKGKLGAGGMGVVYVAADESLDRDVALKVLPEALAGDASSRISLLREARLASRLNHPNVCTIHEAGEEDGKAYIAMELVEGRPLNQRLREGPLALAEVVDLGIQVASALAHAHQRGVIHRDLKCANVMVTPEGRAKVLDFGLAKLLSSDEISEATRALETPTSSGMVVGTLSYLPPEAFRGATRDARSDVWAFGVMLHEMAQGERPFEGSTSFELCSAILHDPPKPLTPAFPDAFKALVGRCLSKNPEDRFRDGSELLTALKTLESRASFRLPAAAAWLLAAAALAGVIFLGVRFLQPRLSAVKAPQPALLRLAIMPLEDLSGRPEEAYLADGLHETLINDLSQFGGLKRVIQRQSVLKFRGSMKTTSEIAKELNVDGILTGSVVRSGNRIRVTAQLIRASGEVTLWSHRFEREMQDLLSLENELVDAIGKEVRGTVQVQISKLPARNRKVNAEAYELMFRGRFLVNQMTPRGFSAGLKLLEASAAKEPGDARIQAALALGYSTAAHDQAGQLAGAAAALRAIALDDSIPDAHCALAMHRMYVEWDWSGAEASFRKALALNPNHPEAHAHLGWLLQLTGRLEEGLREERAAVQADPLSGVYSGWVAWMLWDMGRNDEALGMIQATHKMEPDNPWADFVLAQLLADRGRDADALAAAQRAARKIPMFLGGVGMVHAEAGRRAEALQVIRELEAHGKDQPALFIAMIHGHLGDKEAALRWATKSVENRESWAPYLFPPLNGFQKGLAGLHSDPRFQALGRRVKILK